MPDSTVYEVEIIYSAKRPNGHEAKAMRTEGGRGGVGVSRYLGLLSMSGEKEENRGK